MTDYYTDAVEPELGGYVTLREAAARLPFKTTKSAVWGWVRHGRTVGGVTLRLPYLRVGRRLLVRPADVLAFGQRVAEAEDRLRHPISNERNHS